jgi:hypothetical protein
VRRAQRRLVVLVVIDGGLETFQAGDLVVRGQRRIVGDVVDSPAPLPEGVSTRSLVMVSLI